LSGVKQKLCKPIPHIDTTNCSLLMITLGRLYAHYIPTCKFCVRRKNNPETMTYYRPLWSVFCVIFNINLGHAKLPFISKKKLKLYFILKCKM
jgi:hypothetical protein